MGAFALILASVVFVSASITTNLFESSSEGSEYTSNAYKVTYSITKPGWYLLPSRAVESVGSPKFPTRADTSLDSTQWDSPEYISAKWIFSPFTKKYIAYTNQGDRWWLTDEVVEKFYGITILGEEQMLPMMRYTSLSAGWVYYTKPVILEYEYYPFDIDRSGHDELDLVQAKLKKGWNLIVYPPYAAYDEITIGNCNIERLYGWDDENQKWEPFPNVSDKAQLIKELTNQGSVDASAISGLGMAIKVSDDCNFLTKKESSQINPPAIP